MNLSDTEVIAFRAVSPKTLEHCFCGSVVEIGVVGLKIWFILVLICEGLC